MKLFNVYSGLEVQLITYMDAVDELETLPGGLLYLKLDNPMIKTDKDMNEDEIEELEAEDDLWYEEDYEEGYEEGHHDGYMRGYQAGYEASESGSGYNDTYPIDWSEDDELDDDE